MELTLQHTDLGMFSCSLDTGRLNPETYRLFEAVEKRYNIHIEYTFPDAQETIDLVREKGMFSFYEDGHQECCRVRKVQHQSYPPPSPPRSPPWVPWCQPWQMLPFAFDSFEKHLEPWGSNLRHAWRQQARTPKAKRQ